MDINEWGNQIYSLDWLTESKVIRFDDELLFSISVDNNHSTFDDVTNEMVVATKLINQMFPPGIGN